MLVCGVGINDMPGWCSGTEYQRRVYNCWNRMLSRCYNKSNKDYNTYGAQGVTVCDRWLRLSNFSKDVTKLVGWAAWKASGTNEYHLEKDIIQWGVNKVHKVYSPDTCFFCYYKYNLRERVTRCGIPFNRSSHKKAAILEGNPCYAYNTITGVRIQAYGYNELARILGISHPVVQQACRGIIDPRNNKVISHIKTKGKMKGWGFWNVGEGPMPY